MELRHFFSGGEMPGVIGRDARPMEDVEETELFRRAFPDDWVEMRLVARGCEPSDAGRRFRWEAVLEVARRTLSIPRGRPEPLRSAADVFERYRFLLFDSPVEVFVSVLLDVKHRPLREERVSAGILDGSLIHPREVFSAAVRERAAAVLLLHNHPSGDPSPSGQDREVTRRLRSAGGLLGIPVVDHVILGDDAYFSFREEGDW
jgi:DNA repair protein RadC